MAKKMSFEELQSLWYSRLNTEGFVDIEDTSKEARPLKEWHSFKFSHENHHQRKHQFDEYIERITKFMEHDSFSEICGLIVRHGTCRVTKIEAINIIRMHSQGMSQREIASIVNKDQPRIHWVIKRMKEWMSLV